MSSRLAPPWLDLAVRDQFRRLRAGGPVFAVMVEMKSELLADGVR